MEWDDETLRQAVETGQSLDGALINGFPPLLYTLYVADLDLAATLMEKGVDVNARAPDGSTALHFSAENGMDDIVKALLLKGAHTTVVSNDRQVWSGVYEPGRQPLHMAAAAGKVETLNLLLAAGADPMGRDLGGCTAYETACMKNVEAAAARLLEYSPDAPAFSATAHWTEMARRVHSATVKRVEAKSISGSAALVAECEQLANPSLLTRAIILPGNGCTYADNWYTSVAREVARLGLHIALPGPSLKRDAKLKEWIEHAVTVMGVDENTIIIGHSAGANVALRILQTHAARGAIILAAGRTEVEMSMENAGAFDSDDEVKHPYQWEAIKAHAGWLVQLASTDDRVVPVSEARRIHDELKPKGEYRELDDQGHFIDDKLPLVAEIIREKCKL